MSDPRPEENSRPVSCWFLLLPFCSALLYVLCYVCMRQLAETRVNPFVIVGIREGITAIGGAAVFVFLLAGKKAALPKMKYVLAFLCSSIALQLVGNIVQQKSLEVIGMGISTATCWTGQLLWTPVFGWFLLREKLTLRLTCSLIFAFAALLFLTAGTQMQSGAETVERMETGMCSLAVVYVFLTVLAGFLMATSNCVVRWMNQGGVSPFFAVMFLPGVGGVLLLGWELAAHGMASFYALSSADYFYTILAGLTNMTAFIALTFSLRYLDAVRVCVIMISQLALAPTAGCLLFGETMNGLILTGIVLVVTGILISTGDAKQSGNTKQAEAADQMEAKTL